MPASCYLQQAALAERARNKADRPKVLGGTNYVTPATHGHLPELSRTSVNERLNEAEAQLTYWSGAKARALSDTARSEAAARVTIWEGELRAIKARLAELSTAAA
jgi:hypothetical protein